MSGQVGTAPKSVGGGFQVVDNHLVTEEGSYDLRDDVQLAEALALLSSVGLTLEGGQVVPKDEVSVDGPKAPSQSAPLEQPTVSADTSKLDTEQLQATSESLEGVGQAASGTTSFDSASSMMAMAMKLMLEFDENNQQGYKDMLEALSKPDKPKDAEMLADACDLQNTIDKPCGKFLVQMKLQDMGYTKDQAKSIASAMKDMNGSSGLVLAMAAVQAAPKNQGSEAAQAAAKGQDDLSKISGDEAEKEDNNALFELLLRCLIASAAAKMSDGKAVLDKNSGGKSGGGGSGTP